MGSETASGGIARSAIVAAMLAYDRATSPAGGITSCVAKALPQRAPDGGTLNPMPCTVCGTATYSYAAEWGAMICSAACGELLSWDASLEVRSEEVYDRRDLEYGYCC